MTYETTPTPPPAANRGGRPRRYQRLAEAMATSGRRWVVVPPEEGVTFVSIVTALRRTYFPDHKIQSRQRGDTLYVRLGGKK